MRAIVLAFTLSALSFCPAAAQGVAPSGPAMAGAGRPAVGLADFQARRRAQLMRADADRDGRVSLAEWTAWRSAHPGRGGGDRGGQAGEQAGAPAGAEGMGRGRDPARMFQRLDLNHDGYLTAEEIDAFSARRFSRADGDRDGRLSPDERAGLRQGQREPTQPLNPR